MTWREKLHGRAQANAEIELWTEMKAEGFPSPDMHRLIILLATRPDFFWSEKQTLNHKPLVMFLDGVDVHKDTDKDDHVTFLLEQMGMTVLRYRYNSPMSKAIKEKAKSEARQYLLLEARA
jgi:very-short-patch-repair endonuclease